MVHVSYICCLLLALVAVGLADKSMSSGPITVKVMGKSGKITISAASMADDDSKTPANNSTANNMTTTPATTTTNSATTTKTTRKRRDADDKKNEIIIDMDYVKQLDMDGNEVVAKGNTKQHYSVNIPTVDFTFTDIKDAMLENSKNKDGKKVSVKTFDFHATLDSGSLLKVMMYIAQEDGNITLDTETTEIKKYNVKFNIMLSSWKWCKLDGDCVGQKEGKYVDFAIILKGKGNKGASKAGMSDEYSFGDNQFLLSKQVMTVANNDTATWSAMAKGYPKADTSASGKTTFVFRFPHFEKSATYDPVAKLKIEGSDSTGDVANVVANVLLVAMAMLVAMMQM